MNKFSYIGRPDGLGNRIEEIIRLELICSKRGEECEYIWNNKHSNRSYDIFVQGKNVNVVTPHSNYAEKQLSDFHESFNQEEILMSAKKIIPKFNIYFKNNISPVGIHIRSSDRVGQDHPHFMKDEKELQSYLSETIFLLNNSKPEYIFVCSESDLCRNVFLSHLDKKIKVVDPVCANEVPLSYIDYFALTLCSEIWMLSRFSTFSITASLIANIPLVSFVNDEEIRRRYLAMFKYQSISGKKIVTESLLEQNLRQKFKNIFTFIVKLFS